jgi:GNAT superfamily N-acetyltransferase
LRKEHRRAAFASGNAQVDEQLAKNALQQQSKRLSTSKVLLDAAGAIVGYYTLATGQVDFSDLPFEQAKRLPKRSLPVAILARLGVAATAQGRGLGSILVAQALRDCHDAGTTFAFIAVIVDCVDVAAKRFYEQFDFAELPGHPMRLFLSAAKLEAMMTSA